MPSCMARAEDGRHIYPLRAWVIMPNHVSVLLRPETSLPVITRWLKGSTARHANLILGRTGLVFWQDESFDHRVRDEVELERIVRYVETQSAQTSQRIQATGPGRARGWPAG